MEFKLKPLSIYELGQRANQEDAIYPAVGQATKEDSLYIVCDGMGGHESGEVASNTVCEVISKKIEATSTPNGEFTDSLFEEALAAAYNALDEKDNGATKKMGTTMTFLKLHRDGCTLAHIGDSRIYHIRPSEKKILFQTRDHSLVNDLIKVGELTPEEAKTFKQKNVITRAMQPLLERRPKADIKHITDIRKGDYFFMCSDGMLEEMEDENLLFILSKKGTDEEKIEILKEVSKNNRDNHSAHLIHILDVTPKESDSPQTVKKVSKAVTPPQKRATTQPAPAALPPKKPFYARVIKILLLLILLAISTVLLFKTIDSFKKPSQKADTFELNKDTTP